MRQYERPFLQNKKNQIGFGCGKKRAVYHWLSSYAAHENPARRTKDIFLYSQLLPRQHYITVNVGKSLHIWGNIKGIWTIEQHALWIWCEREKGWRDQNNLTRHLLWGLKKISIAFCYYHFKGRLHNLFLYYICISFYHPVQC